MNTIKNHIPLFLLICFVIIQFIGIQYLYTEYQDTQKQKKEVHLEQNLDKSVKILEREFDKLSILVAGLKSHLQESKTELSPDQIRNYINNQLGFLDYSENIIINFIDKDHRFIYSVGTKFKKVNNLKGSKVQAIRSEKVIAELNELLKTDQIIAFTPLNLYEGHVGLPIDFRFKLNNELKGYYAVIVDIKNLLNPILDSDVKKEFTFRYTSNNEHEFDREQVYDETKVYNEKKDVENLHKDSSAYKYQHSDLLGLPFTIGIAYKEDKVTSTFSDFIQSIFASLLFLLFGSSLLLYFYYQNVQKTKAQDLSNLELTKSKRLLKNFIYASSHDLKQPLINISNFHSLIRKNYASKLDEQANTYFGIVRQNIDHLINLLDDLLIYSRVIKADKVKENIEVKDILHLIASSYDQEKIKIDYQHILPCFGVKSEITRVFQNLIDNAVKYNDNAIVKIKISAIDQVNTVIYTVSDNGIGISKEHQRIVFSEFQRVHKNKYEGTGLGLAICKEIVAHHGGHIQAKLNSSGGTDIIFSISKQ